MIETLSMVIGTILPGLSPRFHTDPTPKRLRNLELLENSDYQLSTAGGTVSDPKYFGLRKMTL